MVQAPNPKVLPSFEVCEMTARNGSECPECGARAPFGTFADRGECPECETPLTTLLRRNA